MFKDLSNSYVSLSIITRILTRSRTSRKVNGVLSEMPQLLRPKCLRMCELWDFNVQSPAFVDTFGAHNHRLQRLRKEVSLVFKNQMQE